MSCFLLTALMFQYTEGSIIIFWYSNDWVAFFSLSCKCTLYFSLSNVEADHGLVTTRLKFLQIKRLQPAVIFDARLDIVHEISIELGIIKLDYKALIIQHSPGAWHIQSVIVVKLNTKWVLQRKCPLMTRLKHLHSTKKKHEELVISEFCFLATDWGGDGCTLHMSRKEPKGAELDPERWWLATRPLLGFWGLHTQSLLWYCGLTMNRLIGKNST